MPAMPFREVREKLTAIFPDFKEWLDEWAICYVEKEGIKTFTYCGIFIELRWFLSERDDLWIPNLLTQLSQLCEQALVEVDHDVKASEDNLFYGVSACFFDSLHPDKGSGNALRPFLGVSSLYMLDNP